MRELPQLVISKIAVGPLSNNAYLLKCRSSGAQIMIDAADETSRLLTLIGTGTLTQILTTHSHKDHWQALAELVAFTGASTAAPEADIESIEPPIDRALHHGDRVVFGDCHVEVITVGGHTPGCSMFLYRDPLGHEHLFSGDALFPGGVGKTSSPEQFEALYNGVTVQVFDQLSDQTWIYPGHGSDTTVGAERPHLTDWRARGW